MRKNLIKHTRDEYRRYTAIHNWRDAYKDQYNLYDRLMDRRAISRINLRRIILDRLADRAQGFGNLSTEVSIENFQDNMRYLIQEIKNFSVIQGSFSSGFRYDRLLTIYLQVFHMYRYLKAHNIDVPKLPRQLKKDFADKIRYAKENDLMLKYQEYCGIFIDSLVGIIPTEEDLTYNRIQTG